MTKSAMVSLQRAHGKSFDRAALPRHGPQRCGSKGQCPSRLSTCGLQTWIGFPREQGSLLGDWILINVVACVTLKMKLEITCFSNVGSVPRFGHWHFLGWLQDSRLSSLGQNSFPGADLHRKQLLQHSGSCSVTGPFITYGDIVTTSFITVCISPRSRCSSS